MNKKQLNQIIKEELIAVLHEAYDTKLKLDLKIIHNGQAIIAPKVLVAFKNKGKILRIQKQINTKDPDPRASSIMSQWHKELTSGFEDLFRGLGISKFELNYSRHPNRLYITASVPDTDPQIVKYLKTMGFR